MTANEFKNQVEEYRKKFKSEDFKYRLISYITLGVCIVCFGVILIIITVVDEKYQLYALIPFFIGLVTIIVFMIFNSKNKKKTQIDSGVQYQENYGETLVKYEYSDIDMEEKVNYLYNGFVSDEELLDPMYFSEIRKSTSRNAVDSKINGNLFTQIDCAIGIPLVDGTMDKKLIEITTRDKKNGADQMVCGLYGRLYTLKKNILTNDEDKIIFTFNTEKSYLPTNRDNLHRYNSNEVGVSERFIPFSTNKDVIKNFIDNNKNFVELLNSIEFNNVLLGGFISINKKGVYVAINFSESSLELPIKDEVDLEKINVLKKTTEAVVNYFKKL